MSAWPRAVSGGNRVSAAVTAPRQPSGNPGATTGHLALPLQHPVAATLLWSAALLVIFMPLSVYRYRTLNR